MNYTTGSPASPSANTEEVKPELRFEFVGMMFAVAVGEIGIKFGQISQNSIMGGNAKFKYAFPAICHLMLAALIIATSWVGWSRSRVSVSIRDVTTVFSGPFVVLLVDVLLVICYFIIVDSVELAVKDDSFTVIPSAKGESFWIFVMFCGYLFWDILTKVFIEAEKGREEAYRFWKRGTVSIILMALALMTWRWFRELGDYWSVVWADLALAALLLLFRALKDVSTVMFPLKRREGSLAASISWSVATLGLWIFASYMACRR